MVGGTRIELVTPCVSSKCSTAELTALPLRSALENKNLQDFASLFWRRSVRPAKYLQSGRQDHSGERV